MKDRIAAHEKDLLKEDTIYASWKKLLEVLRKDDRFWKLE
jgi:hypothetical protein